MLVSIEDYKLFIRKINDSLAEKERVDIFRYLARTDLFFLLWFVLGRDDIEHPWLLARCKEVQISPNGYLDLWAREHYKSTIITFGKTIQDILASHGENPIYSRERTFGIFSCTRPLAKGFLRQIKLEFESNQRLRYLFPDIVWANPKKEAPKWSEDDGLILKRKSNPKEATIEAWGLIDGQPTGKHFTDCIYDDIVTLDNSRSLSMLAKVTESWEMSLNLGSEGGRRRYIGTRYHFNDTYKTIIDRGAARPRIYAATDDGTMDGKPVFMSDEYLADKKKMGSYAFSCQMLLNPISDSKFKFKLENLQYWQGGDASGMNVYILVDPANSKKEGSDYTVMWVIGLHSDNNYYILDIVRDKLSLSERALMLFDLHRKWRPLGVGYESYGIQADVQHIQSKMGEQRYHFSITELGGRTPKFDRIMRLEPVLEAKRLFLPINLFRSNYEGRTVDLVSTFIHEEYLKFPLPEHDDMLDALARILDDKLGAVFPMTYIEERVDRYDYNPARRGSAWAN